MRKEIRIKNSHNKTIYAVLEWQGKSRGPLVVLCHGYRSFGNAPQVVKVAHALRKAGYSTLRIDATNSTGKSSGKLVDFTLMGYVSDIKIVVEYTLKYLKLKEYILIGYSIGGTAVSIVTADDRRVSRLILQSPTYDIPAIFEHRGNFEKLLRQGWLYEYSRILKKRVKIGIAVYNEGKTIDIKKYIKKISCPTLLIHGSMEDERVLRLLAKFYKELVTKKKRHVIRGAGHTLHETKYASNMSDTIVAWLKE